MTESDKKFVEQVRADSEIILYSQKDRLPRLLKIIDEQEIEINRLERELGAEIKDLYNRIAVQEREIKNKNFKMEVVELRLNEILEIVRSGKESNQYEFKTAIGPQPLVVDCGSERPNNLIADKI